MAAKSKALDWSAIENDYRAGIKPLRQLADEHGIRHNAIQKRAKKYGWARDLKERVREKADDMVAKAMVANKVATVTESATIDAYATAQADTRLAHRKDIKTLRETIVAMASELNAAGNKELQEALAVVLDDKCEGMSKQREQALRKAFEAVLSLGGRAGAGQRLASALSTLIDKERQALGIDEQATPESALIVALKRIRGVTD